MVRCVSAGYGRAYALRDSLASGEESERERRARRGVSKRKHKRSSADIVRTETVRTEQCQRPRREEERQGGGDHRALESLSTAFCHRLPLLQ
eukprot:911418-Rhodomonas_salina.1